jgi:hypothetical protein
MLDSNLATIGILGPSILLHHSWFQELPKNIEWKTNASRNWDFKEHYLEHIFLLLTLNRPIRLYFVLNIFFNKSLFPLRSKFDFEPFVPLLLFELLSTTIVASGFPSLLSHVKCWRLEVVMSTPRRNLQSHDTICIALLAIFFSL